MRRLMIGLLGFALLVGGAFAEDVAVIGGKLVKVDGVLAPVAVITGAEQPIDLGELVCLSVKLENHLPQYIKDAKYTWEVPNKRFMGDGASIYFGAGIRKTEIPVKLHAALSYAVGEEIVVRSVESSAIVKIQGELPEPPKPPDPGPPTPKPDVPDETTDAGKFIRNTFTTDNINKEVIHDAAVTLAQSFREVGGKATTYTDISKLLGDLKTSNNTKLGAAGINPMILDGWGDLLKAFLFERYKTGRLRTFDEYKTIFNEIGDAFERVGKLYE